MGSMVEVEIVVEIVGLGEWEGVCDLVLAA